MADQDIEPEGNLYTATDAARILGVSVRSLLDMVMDGDVEMQQHGRGIRLRLADIEVLAEVNELGPIDLTDH